MSTALSTSTQDTTHEQDWQPAAIDDLVRLGLFPGASRTELARLVSHATLEEAPAGELVVDETEQLESFLILLDGTVGVSRKNRNGQYHFKKKVEAPSFLGEVPLLAAIPAQISMHTVTPVRFLRLQTQAFWEMMAGCPFIRQKVLTEMSMRVVGMQQQQSQQEKLAMLGTMTAGLMHELNNPGAAARRAASQLRSNLQRMHEVARTFSEHGHTVDQQACLSRLQARVLAVRSDLCMSSLQESDAEEQLGEWLDEHHVERAWEFAPVLVSSGIQPMDLDCLAGVFSESEIAQPIQWLESTASSMQMVALVEESVAKVVELAQAVKSYAHEGQGGLQDVDVNESIHGTMVMLKHKFREKNVQLQKDFGPGLPKLRCICSGLNQVWTNLLDNAIDAVPQGGRIGVRTSVQDGEVQIAISDNGAGISPEDQERIFDPFFTTKAAGVGSGLGLGIVRRILENYKGSLTLESHPGKTEFTIHIPVEQSA